MNGLDHEQAFVKAFVLKSRQQRSLSLLSSPKSRRKFTDLLGHFQWFDNRYATPLKWQPNSQGSIWERHLSGIEKIAALLKSHGAGETCWVISLIRSIDGQELPLEKAIEASLGGDGVILSCVPGKLAYYNGEDESLLLQR